MQKTEYSMDEIEVLVRAYAEARRELEHVTTVIQEDRIKILRSRLPVLKRRIAKASAAKDELQAAIEVSQHLFEKSKTQAVDGVKFGYRKKPGRFQVRDEAKSVALVRKHLPKLGGALVVTTEKLDKAALKKLTAQQLARIGVTLEDDTDEVTIAAAAGDLEKLVDALLGDIGDAED